MVDVFTYENYMRNLQLYFIEIGKQKKGVRLVGGLVYIVVP